MVAAYLVYSLLFSSSLGFGWCGGVGGAGTSFFLMAGLYAATAPFLMYVGNTC